MPRVAAAIPTIPEGHRRCSGCEQTKPVAEFYIKNKATGQRQSRCKVCNNAAASARFKADPAAHLARTVAWRRAHPARVAAIAAASRDRNREALRERDRERGAAPEHKAKKAAYRAANAEQRRAYNAAYRELHREARAAYSRAYYVANRDACLARIKAAIAANPDKYRAIHRDWKQANKDAVNASTHRRRAAIRGDGSTWTAAEWQAIKAGQGYRCLWCGKPEPAIALCFDHVIPVSLGGPNTAANGQGLCRSCNSKKHRLVLDLRQHA